MKKIIITQFVVLLIGTVFAWFNFLSELINWLAKRACTTGCSVGLVNPFLTPCLYGAVFFAIAFVLSAILLKKVQK
jgi:uncharacterized membrane protein